MMRSFVVCQWIWHESHFYARGWLIFHGGGVASPMSSSLNSPTEITVGAIFSSGQIFVIVIFAVPFRHKCIRADCELI